MAPVTEAMSELSKAPVWVAGGPAGDPHPRAATKRIREGIKDQKNSLRFRARHRFQAEITIS